jgi:methionine synthase II (cobalamin-independent)
MPPFRADRVGSLLRPPQLLAARADHAAGRIPPAKLRRIEDEAIKQIVRNLLTVEEQVAKLRLVVDTAREVWG